jgi:hypothetical protein
MDFLRNAQKRTKKCVKKNILGLVPGSSKVYQIYAGVRRFFGVPLAPPRHPSSDLQYPKLPARQWERRGGVAIAAVPNPQPPSPQSAACVKRFMVLHLQHSSIWPVQAPSTAHHALPVSVSGQSSAVHVPLCRCVSCALCENLRAPNRTPHPSRCALRAARCLHL